MTVDAVRAGYRLREYELDLEHRATGRNLAGFLHRAGSCGISLVFTGHGRGGPAGSQEVSDADREKRLAGLAVLAVALVFGASLANAELVERGNLFVKFSGGIDPTNAAAPRTTRRSRSASTAPCGRSPATGRRRCASSRSRSTAAAGSKPRACRAAGARRSRRRPRATALEACGDALVGTGRYRRRRRLPRTGPPSPAGPDPRLQHGDRRRAGDPRPRLRQRPVPEQPHLRLPHPQVARHLRDGPHRRPARRRSTATAT